MTFESYERFVEEVVLPRKQANPSHLRLDGSPTGGNWAIAGIFRHDGRYWKVHEDSHYQPLMIAYEAAREGRDPFVHDTTRKGAACLSLRPNLRSLQSTAYKHLYIYGVS